MGDERHRQDLGKPLVIAAKSKSIKGQTVPKSV